MQIKALTIWIAVIKERKAVSRSSYNFPFSECGFSLLKANGSEIWVGDGEDANWIPQQQTVEKEPNDRLSNPTGVDIAQLFILKC